jgi:hypothetical protein
MKRFLLTVAILLTAALSFAQDRQAILDVLHKQELAWNKGDVESFMLGYWKSDS